MHGTEKLKDTIFVENFKTFNFYLGIFALKLILDEIFVKNCQQGPCHGLRRSRVVEGGTWGFIRRGYHNIMQNFSCVRFFSTKFPNFHGLIIVFFLIYVICNENEPGNLKYSFPLFRPFLFVYPGYRFYFTSFFCGLIYKISYYTRIFTTLPLIFFSLVALEFNVELYYSFPSQIVIYHDWLLMNDFNLEFKIEASKIIVYKSNN